MSTNFTQHSAVALTNGVSSQAIVFPVAFINAPFEILTQVFKSGAGTANITATVLATSITTTGFTVYFSGAIPDANYTLAYQATAVQPVPTAQDNCASGNGGCGCAPAATVANCCPPPQLGAYLFTGAQGRAGPLAFFRGAYDASTVYFDNTARVDVVSYGGYYWAANNVAKNDTASWGTPTVGSGDWTPIGPTSAGLLGGYNSAQNSFIAAPGNGSITPAAANHTSFLALTGIAGTYNVSIPMAGRNAGDRCDVVLTFPSTAGLIVTMRNDTAGGTLLLPVSSGFVGNAYTTDGVTLSATWRFAVNNTGTAWIYTGGSSPS